MRITSVTTSVATDVYTSGELFGTIVVMVIGILIITNEFAHQTATPTFLAAPRRIQVIVAKLVAAVGIGALYGIATELISVPVGAIVLGGRAGGTQLTTGSVLATVGDLADDRVEHDLEQPRTEEDQADLERGEAVGGEVERHEDPRDAEEQSRQRVEPERADVAWVV